MTEPPKIPKLISLARTFLHVSICVLIGSWMLGAAVAMLGGIVWYLAATLIFALLALIIRFTRRRRSDKSW
jgi:uncharacterized membrane protein